MSSSPTTATLPRGRHAISRADVEGHQRARILVALVDQVAARGYGATSIGHIVAGARVSRETFYALFANKEACYRAAERAHGERVLVAAGAFDDGDAAPLERLRASLTQYLTGLSADPAVARCFVIERPPRTPESDAEQQAFVAQLAASVTTLLGTDDAFTGTAYVALVRQLVADHVNAGRTAELGDLVDPILGLVAAVLRGRVSVTP